MKIAHVVNKITHTSIPVELAEIMGTDNDVLIISLYDTQNQAAEAVKRIAPHCNAVGFAFKSNPLSAINKFRKALLRNDINVVHTHHALSGAFARMLAYGSDGVKIIHTIHADHHGFTIWQNLIIGLTLSKCDAIVFNSEATKLGLYEWQRRTIKNLKQCVIYNGVDTDRILNADSSYARRFCDLHSIGDDEILFIQVGRLERIKNPLTTARAYAGFTKKHPDDAARSRLIFVGDGSEREILEKEVGDIPAGRVIFTGMIQRDDVYSLMNRADVMIVPSFSEGFCNALFEAMTAGLKLIVSDIPVFNELIADQGLIIKTNPNDTDMLSDIMFQAAIQVSEDSIIPIQDNVHKIYSLSECKRKYVTLYHMLVTDEKC